MPDSVKRQFSDLDSMLFSCSFNNRRCNSSHFEWIWHPYFFGCYRFNSGFDSNGLKTDLWKSTLAGRSFRFVVNLYTGLPNQFSQYASHRFFNLFIQNASDYPYITKPSPYLLSSITGTTISVKRSYFSQFNEWPYAYSECRVNENNELIGEPLADRYLFDQVVASNYSYTRDTCLNFCAQVMTAKVCKCNYDVRPLRVDDFDICLTSEQTGCAVNFYYNTFIVGDFIKNNCLDKCPLECNRRTFTTRQSYFQYPTAYQSGSLFYHNNAFMSTHANQTDATVLNKLYYNMISASVFYESLSYSMAEERPAIVMTELIGSVGGHLHIFLGMSLLSFVEIIELGAFAFISLKKNRKNKLKPVVDQSLTNTNADPSIHQLKEHIDVLKIDGLPNIVKSKHFLLTIAWATIFATSFSVCVWLVVVAVTEYLKYEVSKPQTLTFHLK